MTTEFNVENYLIRREQSFPAKQLRIYLFNFSDLESLKCLSKGHTNTLSVDVGSKRLGLSTGTNIHYDYRVKEYLEEVLNVLSILFQDLESNRSRAKKIH